MAVRLPLTTVLNSENSGLLGAASVAGGIALPFYLPQDVDGVVVKLTASTVGGGVSAVFQTTDDGGSTWYDCARTSVVSNANNTTAQWLSIPVTGLGTATAVNGFPTASILTVGIGNAAASTLAQRQISGLPVLSTYNRVFLRLDAGLTGVASVVTKVMANSQSASN